MKKQQGFTLIELIVVIVILGILAATALPKFINLQTDARLAAVKGVAGALTSAGTINYGARSMGASSTAYASTYATSGNSCASIAANILQGGAPTGYSFNAGTISGAMVSCPVVDQVDGTISAVASVPLI